MMKRSVLKWFIFKLKKLSVSTSLYLEPTNEENEMKSLFFITAIQNKNKLRFLYDMEEIILEPIFISRRKDGKKVLFGKDIISNNFRTFDYSKICNIKIISLEIKQLNKIIITLN